MKHTQVLCCALCVNAYHTLVGWESVRGGLSTLSPHFHQSTSFPRSPLNSSTWCSLWPAPRRRRRRRPRTSGTLQLRASLKRSSECHWDFLPGGSSGLQPPQPPRPMTQPPQPQPLPSDTYSYFAWSAPLLGAFLFCLSAKLRAQSFVSHTAEIIHQRNSFVRERSDDNLIAANKHAAVTNKNP